MKPLTNLTKKNQPWVWKQDQQQASEKILTAVIDSISCMYPNLNKPFTLWLTTVTDSEKKVVLAEITRVIEEDGD